MVHSVFMRMVIGGRALLLTVVFFLIAAGCSKKSTISSAGDYSVGRPEATTTALAEPSQRGQSKSDSERNPIPTETAQAPLTPPVERIAQEPVSPPPPVSAPTPKSTAPAPEPVQEPPPTDQRVVTDIYFDYNRYTIKKESHHVLAAIATWIENHPNVTIIIEGHCDERGTLAYNLILGEKRAKAVKQHLEDLGIPGSRLKIISYGETRPICEEHKEECWWTNRRAHLRPQ